MRKKCLSIIEVKDNLESLKGKLLEIRINKGRKKIVRCSGFVCEIYPSVFTLKLDDDSAVTAYSYNDVICGTVVIVDN